MTLPIDDSKIQRHKSYGKKIFLIGSSVFVIGILLFILILNYTSQSGIETDPAVIARNLIVFGSIFVGLIMIIIGYIKWPSRERSPREKKVLNVAGLTIVFIFSGLIIGFFVFSGMECLQVKNDYENNPEFAQEQYGYVTFEQWLEGNGSKYAKNCMPDIDVGLIPG